MRYDEGKRDEGSGSLEKTDSLRAVGLALAVLAQALQNGSSRLTSLERPDFEGEEQQILVEGLGEEGIPLEVQISPRQYKPEEGPRCISRF